LFATNSYFYLCFYFYLHADHTALHSFPTRRSSDLVNHTSRGSISTSTLPSIKLRKCSSKIITSILSFISGRLAAAFPELNAWEQIGRAVQQECRDRSRMPSSA